MMRIQCAVATALSCMLACSCTVGSTDLGDPLVGAGPAQLEIDGDPNGVWWSAEDSTLYLADDDHNRVLKWVDGEGFAEVVTLPPASEEGPGLGQLVRMDDGTIVVTRFGYGTTGDVVVVDPDGNTSVVPNLDPERRRIGLGLDEQGRLWTAYFRRVGDERVGAIAALDLAGAEPDIVTGLRKPIGVLVRGETMYFSDQDLGGLYRVELAAPTEWTQIAEIDAPDLIAWGPDGRILVGSGAGLVHLIADDGTIESVATVGETIRGVGWDGAGGRMFVVQHDDGEADGLTNYLHVLPLD